MSTNKDSLYFWNDWSASYRYAYLGLLGLLFLSMAFFVYAYYQGLAMFFDWQIVENLGGSKVSIAQVEIGPFSLPLESPLFLIDQSFEVAPIQFKAYPYYAMGLVLLLVISILLALFSELKNWVYGLGMSFFILFLGSLNLDLLGINLGFNNSFLLTCILLYLIPSYLLYAFFTKVPFIARAGIFFFISLGLGYWAFSASQLTHNLAHLISFGLLVPMIISAIFVVITGQEILRSFWHLLGTYNQSGGTNNLVHFSLISVFLILNLAYLYIRDRAWINLDIYTLDPYWLLLLATPMGIWGSKERYLYTRLGNWIPFRHLGAFLYLIMALITFSTLNFCLVLGNDSFIKAMRNWTLFAQLGFNLAFMFYVLANFAQLVREKASLAGLTYKGHLIPLSLMYYFGIGVIVSFFVGSRNIVLYLGQGAYYANVADAYYQNKDIRLAGSTYQLVRDRHDFVSHKANFMLSELAEEMEQPYLKLTFLKDAYSRTKSDYAQVRLANLMRDNNLKFESLFSLQEAVREKPNSLALSINLASAYEENGLKDSTFYFLERAERIAPQSPIPQNKLWAILAENPSQEAQLDSLPGVKGGLSNTLGWANKLALYNSYHLPLNLPESLRDSSYIQKAGDAEFSYVYNYVLNQLRQPGSMKNSLSFLQQFMHLDSLRAYGYHPRLLRAFALYYGGEVQAGVQAISALPNMERDPFPNTVAGLWLLEQKAYGTALSYFQKAQQLGNTEALFYQAITRSEMQDFDNALPVWVQLLEQNPEENSPKRIWASRMLKVFSDSTQLNDDVDKYNYLHYRKSTLPEDILSSVWLSIQDPNLKHRAAAELTLEYIRREDLGRANQIYTALKPSNQVSAYNQSFINFAYAKLLLAEKNYDKLLAELPQLSFEYQHENYRPYFRAMALAKKGQSEGLENLFITARKATPFDEEIILGLAQYYLEEQKDVEKAYLTVVEGVRTNPFSLDLQKSYAFLALDMGLDSYSEKALETIQELSRPQEFEAYLQKYQEYEKAVKARREARLEELEP